MKQALEGAAGLSWEGEREFWGWQLTVIYSQASLQGSVASDSPDPKSENPGTTLTQTPGPARPTERSHSLWVPHPGCTQSGEIQGFSPKPAPATSDNS